MKTNLLFALLFLLLLNSSCEKPTVEPTPPNAQLNSFQGTIFNQPVSFTVGLNNFETRTGNWSSGDQSYAELGLATAEPQINQTELVVNSKTIDGQLTADKFKALFAVGSKSAEGNFGGYHVSYRSAGQLFTSVGGEQPTNFLEVTKVEQLSGDAVKNHFKFKVTFNINCNLYEYAAPHEYAGKIENGELICYFVRN